MTPGAQTRGRRRARAAGLQKPRSQPLLRGHDHGPPIVVRSDSVIEVRLTGRTTSRAQVTYDGALLGDLEPDGRLVVEPAPETVTLLHPHGHDYYRILRSKLHWGRSARDSDRES